MTQSGRALNADSVNTSMSKWSRRRKQDVYTAAASASMVIAFFVLFVWFGGGYSTLSSMLSAMGRYFALWWALTLLSTAVALYLVDAANHHLFGRSEPAPVTDSRSSYRVSHLITVTFVAVLSILTLLVAVSRSASY